MCRRQQHLYCRGRHPAALLCFCLLTYSMAAAVDHCADRNKPRILTFGDSLTEGLYFSDTGARLSRHERTVFHPYALRLGQLLNESKIDVAVVESGKSGEQVEPYMQIRLQEELSGAALPRGLMPTLHRNGLHEPDEAVAPATPCRWDVVVLMGGINDIGRGHSPKRVFDGLMAMKDQVIKSGGTAFLLTLLDTFIPKADAMSANRETVNTMLRAQCPNQITSSSSTSAATAGAAARCAVVYECSPGCYLVDVAPCVPFTSYDHAAQGGLWGTDGLHMRAAGYDRLGELVFHALQDVFGPKLEKLAVRTTTAR